MNPRRILIALLLYAIALSGFLTYLDMRAIREPAWVALATSLIFSGLIFWWYLADTEEQRYRRTALLNIAVIVISVIAVPYYVLRSRAKGERLKAFGRLIGFFVLMLIAMLVGGFAASLAG
jgi:uncharacterized protein YqgC (DUF456 family)